MKKIVCGVMAHVDSGKTTLSEGLLYLSGNIRKFGRVDNKDAFLDTHHMEKERGITIFSKQAVFNTKNTAITLIDTPGHIDFQAEMERSLQIMDYAILVISAADGIASHTKTVWYLLNKYNIPTFIFVNKMDQELADKATIYEQLKENLSQEIVDFSNDEDDKFFENVAATDEAAMEAFFESGFLSKDLIAKLIQERKVFPCYFGSALKLYGIEELLSGIDQYTIEKSYKDEFSARVYKIGRDESGNRLTYVKITGGKLNVRDMFGEEKVSQIRIYSGAKYNAVASVKAGEVCTLLGLNNTNVGMSVGAMEDTFVPFLEPVLSCSIELSKGIDPNMVLPKLYQLCEEEPLLDIVWNEELREIQAKVMGEVQLEILKAQVKERFDVDISFGEGKIVYKESIENVVEGVGHFEPLRHYAEVHLILEPGIRGSGITFESICSEDVLDKNWQRLIKTHIFEREHRGVLTGAPITDIHISLATGRAHTKHTVGGDFKQATYRAIRQGLMQAKSVLLEPYFEFRLEVPSSFVGRAMTDIEKMYGKCEVSAMTENSSTIEGIAPVSTMRNYQKEVMQYTKGEGHLMVIFAGYGKCHNEAEVVASKAYNPESDVRNTPDSVFCANGSGYIVKWNQVSKYMHMENVLEPQIKEVKPVTVGAEFDDGIGVDEIDAIIERTFFANKKKKDKKPKKAISYTYKTVKTKPKKGNFLLVDGYNVIFADKELSELAKINIDGARLKLADILCNYQAIKGMEVILVFDAYRVKNHQTETIAYNNISIVYTKTAETADQYIEKYAHKNGSEYNITVATSDGLEQVIIRGAGASLLSSRELLLEIENAKEIFRNEYHLT